MIVVVLIGIIATLATFGVRKYILTAKASEAAAVLTSIKAAEEAYRQDTFVYLDVSGGSFANRHPSATPGAFKRSWQGDGDSAATSANFRELGVDVAGPVSFTYGVVAGQTGTSFPTLPTSKSDWNFPSTASEPFYIAFAVGDLDGDGNLSYVIAHSLTTDVYSENTGE